MAGRRARWQRSQISQLWRAEDERRRVPGLNEHVSVEVLDRARDLDFAALELDETRLDHDELEGRRELCISTRSGLGAPGRDIT